MSTNREPIGVIGTGYVGLVTAAGFAELGNDVYCVDIDAEKIEGLRQGRMPIWEPGLAELVERHRDRLHFSTDLAAALEHARLLFVAVGTPPTYSGDADLSAVHAVVGAMPASDSHALIMKSTVPVGTGETIQRVFAEQGKGFKYVSCPEFLKEGSAIKDFLEPDRVVVGDEGDWAGDAVAELYAPLEAPLVRTDIKSAEMVKLASNAFLATKISFINEIANVCEETGADVVEVARGMGLDNRIGPKFLQAGIGFGGSCLAGDETVLVRRLGRTRLLPLEELFSDLSFDLHPDQAAAGHLRPFDLEVLSWSSETGNTEWRSVAAVTRRRYTGELLQVRTKTGRRVRATPDHVFVTEGGIKRTEQLTTGDWLPLAQGSPAGAVASAPRRLRVTRYLPVSRERVIVRPATRELAALGAPSAHAVRSRSRLHDIKRSGALRLDELGRLGLSEDGATYGTARNGTYVPGEIVADSAFWRVAGLYLSEGHCGSDGDRRRLAWSFHPTREQDLVAEVAHFWRALGVKVDVRRTPTAMQVSVSSRILAHWWTGDLGLGSRSESHRIPDAIWDEPLTHKRALLAGLWRGDGSWSLVNGGPSVILEYGTVSPQLADGMLRLLGELGVVASQRVGRTSKSTMDTYWLRISGAAQVERMLGLVAERDRPGIEASIARQSKRIAPTGHRRDDRGRAWLRVTDVCTEPEFDDFVYSLEVPGPETVVTTAGLVLHNCFPKDVTALKQLAGNSGYHFQLLNSVIEVNELQKRRVIAKLEKHLGKLVDKQIALLGLAFKPNTDDMREASSLVLSSRLQAAGAHVRAYDPVAEGEARKLLRGVAFKESAAGAVEGADAIVLVTEWPEFAALDLAALAGTMRGNLLVDGRNLYEPERVREAGLVYEGIGRAARRAAHVVEA